MNIHNILSLDVSSDLLHFYHANFAGCFDVYVMAWTCFILFGWYSSHHFIHSNFLVDWSLLKIHEVIWYF